MAEMTEYKQGETATFWVTYKNRAGEEVDPTTHTISAEHEDGTNLFKAEELSKSELGVWYYKHTFSITEVPGNYHAEAIVAKNGDVSTPHTWFVIVDRIVSA